MLCCVLSSCTCCWLRCPSCGPAAAPALLRCGMPAKWHACLHARRLPSLADHNLPFPCPALPCFLQVWSLMCLAYAAHEIVSDYTTAALMWFETGCVLLPIVPLPIVPLPIVLLPASCCRPAAACLPAGR